MRRPNYFATRSHADSNSRRCGERKVVQALSRECDGYATHRLTRAGQSTLDKGARPRGTELVQGSLLRAGRDRTAQKGREARTTECDRREDRRACTRSWFVHGNNGHGMPSLQPTPRDEEPRRRPSEPRPSRRTTCQLVRATVVAGPAARANGKAKQLLANKRADEVARRIANKYAIRRARSDHRTCMKLKRLVLLESSRTT